MAVDSSEVIRFQQDQAFRDFGSAVALGVIPAVEVEVKFGNVVNAVLNVRTDIWALGGTQPVYIFPDGAGEGITAVSDNGADTMQIVIEGLDMDGLPQSETVILTGTTPVVVPGIWKVVQRTFNDSDVEFLGLVTTQGNGIVSTNVFTAMTTEDQQTSQAIYEIPSNRVGVINNYSTAINEGGNQDAVAIMSFAVARPGKVFRNQIRYGLQKRGTSNISSDLIVPPVMGPGYRLKVRGRPDSGPMDISGEFSILLVDPTVVPDNVLAQL